MKFHLELQHTYELSSVSELENGISVHYFDRFGASMGCDGMLIKVNNSSTESWLGVFGFGMSSFSGVYAMPSEELFCVVAQGAGYIVSANDPKTFEIIPSTPIIDVKIAPEYNIIVFANHTDLIAYDKRGFMWRSGRLSFDDLKLTSVEGAYILGEYFDIRSEKIESFKVDLRTGSHTASQPPILW